jgi:hypothetical protein
MHCPDSDWVANATCYIQPRDYQTDPNFAPNIHAAPAFYPTDGTTGYLYLMAEKDYLKAYRYDLTRRRFDCARQQPVNQCASATQPPSSDARDQQVPRDSGVDCNPVAVGCDFRAPDGMPGGALSVSTSAGANGIVWALWPTHDAVGHPRTGTDCSCSPSTDHLCKAAGHNSVGYLAAADASTLRRLWRDDVLEPFSKFVPPTVAGSYVLRATMDYSDPLQPPSAPAGTVVEYKDQEAPLNPCNQPYNHPYARLIVYGFRSTPTAAGGGGRKTCSDWHCDALPNGVTDCHCGPYLHRVTSP